MRTLFGQRHPPCSRAPKLTFFLNGFPIGAISSHLLERHFSNKQESIHSFVSLLIMKNALLVAASAMLGSAAAGLHRMKLQKVPLHEQLVSTLIYQNLVIELLATYILC